MDGRREQVETAAGVRVRPRAIVQRGTLGCSTVHARARRLWNYRWHGEVQLDLSHSVWARTLHEMRVELR